MLRVKIATLIAYGLNKASPFVISRSKFELSSTWLFGLTRTLQLELDAIIVLLHTKLLYGMQSPASPWAYLVEEPSLVQQKQITLRCRMAGLYRYRWG